MNTSVIYYCKSEYMTFRKEYTDVLTPHAELSNYLRLGGFPAVHLQQYTPDEIYTIVKDIYNSTIFTDIVRRNQIIRDNYPKYVLRADAFAGGNYEGIKTMHIADFLLSDEY